MVFGILFLLFALMHDIKLWTYTVPGGYFSSCNQASASCETLAFAVSKPSEGRLYE